MWGGERMGGEGKVKAEMNVTAGTCKCRRHSGQHQAAMQEGTKQQLPSACSGSGSASEAAVERALPAGHHPGPSRSPPGMGIFCHCDPV